MSRTDATPEQAETGPRFATPLLLAALAVAALVIAWALWPQDADATLGQTVTDDGAGGVTVTATREAAGTFLVSLDTHTVDLAGYDLLQRIVLETPDGRVAAGPGSEILTRSGHHVQARLVFDVGGAATLVAEDLAGVPERRLVFA